MGVLSNHLRFLSARIPRQRPAPVGNSTLEQTLRLTTPTPHVTALRTTGLTKIRHYPRTPDSCSALSYLRKFKKKKKERKKKSSI